MIGETAKCLTGIEPVSDQRMVAHRGGNPGRLVVGKLCPRLCPNQCLPSTNTVTYGQIPRDMLAGLTR
jgi:hypothetical protein